MNATKEVSTSVGKFVVKKPKAGLRNKVLMEAETETGFKQTVILMKLLPRCIQERPESFNKEIPIDDILDDLEIEDYDLLIEALNDLIIGESYPEKKSS